MAELLGGMHGRVGLAWVGGWGGRGGWVDGCKDERGRPRCVVKALCLFVSWCGSPR